MNKSLQDQLINSGLIDRKKARKITADQQKNRRKLRGSVASQNIQTLDNEAANANAQRDRELNRQRQEQSERKAIAAQIRQIVHANRLPREQEGDATFNFVVRGKVKRINLSEETRKRISTGGLAIVEVDSRYDLVPSGVAENYGKEMQRALFSITIQIKEPRRWKTTMLTSRFPMIWFGSLS